MKGRDTDAYADRSSQLAWHHTTRTQLSTLGTYSDNKDDATHPPLRRHVLELRMGFTESSVHFFSTLSFSVSHKPMKEGTALCPPLSWLPKLTHQGPLVSVTWYQTLYILRTKILYHRKGSKGRSPGSWVITVRILPLYHSTNKEVPSEREERRKGWKWEGVLRGGRKPNLGHSVAQLNG